MRCYCPARTTRCGARPPSSMAAARAITVAWRRTRTSPIRTSWKRWSRHVPARWSCSTRTTRPARCNRARWLSLSGDPARTCTYRDALQLLAALRMCANVTAQWTIKPALTGRTTITALTAPGGRLHEARRAVLEGVAASRFLDVIAPAGALYAFPQVRAEHLTLLPPPAQVAEVVVRSERVLSRMAQEQAHRSAVA